MDRKNFLKKAGALGISGFMSGKVNNLGVVSDRSERIINKSDREYWISTVDKISKPVLTALSQDKLKQTMPVEEKPGSNRKRYTYLEAFGRLMTGIAPWLELGKDNTPEGKIRSKYIDWALKSLSVAVNTDSKDFLNFNKGDQPLVDTAFLAHALIKAPTVLWENSSRKSQDNIIKALKSSRVIVPYYDNWILFSAMVETALVKLGADADLVRIDLALHTLDSWYMGDGIYGDGPHFHWDYYNSYVIQPFMLTILDVMRKHHHKYQNQYDRALKYSHRYGEILERLIAPDGSYPAIGRSITYRYGAFQLLSQLAWMDTLPSGLTPNRVRSSLTKVIKKINKAPDMFDKDGWLNIGLYGHQPHLGEGYISTGSLYLCMAVFLPLGLKPDHTFWTGPDKSSIESEIWSGKDMQADHSI